MSEPTKGLPTDAELRAIVAKKPAVWWAEASDIAAEILRLRAELAKAKRCLERHGFVDNGGQEWKPPLGPTPHRFAGAAALATSYGASQEAKAEPPADVLGEAFRMWMDRADADKRVSASIYRAVDELAKVVERIARQQEAK